MFAANIEIARINDAGAGSPGDYFLNLSFADLEIVIEKFSWMDRQALPALAHVLDRKIGEFDFWPSWYFTRVPYETFCSDAACPQLTGPARANKPPKRKTSVKLLVTSGSFRGFRKRRKRFVDLNPGQFIFEPDRFLRRKWPRIVFLTIRALLAPVAR